MISVLLYILKYIVKAIIGLFNFGLTVFALLTFVTKLLQFVVGRKADNISDGSIRHVLVTGGSSGIGLEVARLYIIKGFKVTIVARNKQKLEEARHELARTLKDVFREPSVRVEDRIMAISCDVGSNEAEVQKAFQPAISKFGDVDILVNSAGTSIAGEFDELDSKEFERMLHINVLGSVYPTRVVVPAMKKNNMGRIVFVSSQVAQAAIHGYSAYAASKWALRGLAESLQMELKPYNIWVSISYPPDTNTPGYQEEMLTKPSITKKISESGEVFSPELVAKSIVDDSEAHHYSISTGLDGWFLKQVHCGMTPVNNVLEVTFQIMFASLLRLVSVFYSLYWEYLVGSEHKKALSNKDKKKD